MNPSGKPSEDGYMARSSNCISTLSLSRLNRQLLQRQHRRHSFMLKTSFARGMHSPVTRRALLRARAADVNDIIRSRNRLIRGLS